MIIKETVLSIREEMKEDSDIVPIHLVSETEAIEQLPEWTDSNCHRSFYVANRKVVVSDMRLGDALCYVLPKYRNVIHMSFFLQYNDTQIARMMTVTNTAIAYRKKQGLKLLRKQLEAMNGANTIYDDFAC